MEYILLNNLENNYSLLMQFGNFMSYYKIKIYQKIQQKLPPEN